MSISTLRAVAFLTIVASGLATGCGQAVDNGTPSSHADSGADSTAGASVTLIHGGESATVDLSSLTTVNYKDTAVVSLEAVWTAGGLGEASGLEFDFEADDGFHPSSKSKCAKNLTGAELPMGYIIPDTRSLVWDDSLGLPGCYSVQGVAKIIGLDVGE